MIRITDQYLWNFVFLVFFLVLIAMGAIILETEARLTYTELAWSDYLLIVLATWRLTRLCVNDTIMKWFREQFYDAVADKKQILLVKPARGPRRTIADLMSCPWCFGMWAGAMVTFFYLLTSYAIFPVMILALSAVATFLHLLATQVGARAEQLKNQNEGRL